MAIELEPTAAQLAYRAQMRQRRAFAAAQSKGDASFAHEIIPEPSMVHHGKFKAALAAEAIRQAHRGDPSNLVKGLVQTFNSFS